MYKMQFIILVVLLFVPGTASAFSRTTYAVFNGESIGPDAIEDTLETIEANKLANKKKKNKKNPLPTSLDIIEAFQPDPTNIQFFINTSGITGKSQKDIQLPITNTQMKEAVELALMTVEDYPESDIMFAPLKLTDAQVDSEDGINVITARAIEAPPGVSDGFGVFTVFNVATSDTVILGDRTITVKPGTIYDSDIVFDPSNDNCLALFTADGEFKIGGNSDSALVHGGFDTELAEENCEDRLKAGDITQLTMRALGNFLGLETSPNPSAVFSNSLNGQLRYSFINDDKIALANVYPNEEFLNQHGKITGKVTVNGKAITGAHVVFEEVESGEPVASTITNHNGEYLISAIPKGKYNVYAEPFDSIAFPDDLVFNVFGKAANNKFSTVFLKEPIEVTPAVKGKLQTVNLNADNQKKKGFNIHPQGESLTENEFITAGIRGIFAPAKLFPGNEITVTLWGDNITNEFGTLTISGNHCMVTSQEDISAPISPIVEVDEEGNIIKEADQIPGIQAVIACPIGTPPGPKTLIFTGDKLDPEESAFGQRDQLTGYILVKEE